MPDKLEKSLSEYTKGRPKAKTQIAGLLGIFLGGIQHIEVPNRNGYVFVRLRNNTSELIQAWNDQVAIVYDLPVLVEWNGHRYIVTGRDTERYAPAGFGWGSQSTYLPKHGSQHSFAPELGYGGDVAWIYSRQIMPFATTPSGTAGAPVVWVQPHVYRNPADGSWEYIGDGVSPNLLAAKPTGTFARMLLLYWDLDSDSAKIITGSYFSESFTGTSSILPYVPTVSNSRHIPLSAIRLVSGTTGVLWDNIYDMRQWANTQSSPFDGCFSVWDEGIPVGTGTTLNFVGENVHASVSGSVIRVFITGSTGGGGGTEFAGVDQIGVMGQDEGVPQGSGTVLNVTGEAVLSRSGTILNLHVPGGAQGPSGPAGAFGVMGQDEGLNLGTGTTLNFVGAGVTATISGTVLNVNVPGGSSNGLTQVIRRKPEDEFRTGTAIAPDASISFSGTMGQVWAFEAKYILFSSINTTDFRMGISVTGSSSYWGFYGGGNRDWESEITTNNAATLFTGVNVATMGSIGGVWGVAFGGVVEIGVAYADIDLLWSTNTAPPQSGTTMLKNSYTIWTLLNP